MGFVGHIKKFTADQSGMTLIDICMVMIVIGLLLAPALSSYKEWKNNKEKSTTTSNIQAVHKAIADYYFDFGAYPCPALPNLSPGDADYGNADCANTDPDNDNVMIGTLPFATLKIPTSLTLDGWHNKYKYAVTKSLTDKTTFNNNNGLLILNKFNQDPVTFACVSPRTIVPDRADVHYVVVSLGPTGRGAYTADGVLRTACPASGAATDSENCDDDKTFVETVCAASDISGKDFYDDVLDYMKSAPTRLWTYAGANDVYSNIPLVGINNLDPQVGLHVIGNIKAGRIDVAPDTMGGLCDITGNNCFEPELLTGNDPRMDCSSSSSAIGGIANSQAQCGSATSLSQQSCTGGKYVIGINSAGKVVCGM